jgi:hypothetical protein
MSELAKKATRSRPNGELSDARAKAELGRFKGIGPKTISCVLLFALDRAEFPVNSHVLRISQQMNWVSQSATREAAYERLNAVVPDELKMDWHCLLVAHGKVCHDCAARGKPQFPPRDGGRIDCPLVRIRKGRCLDVLKERVDEKVALVASKSRGLEKTKAAVDKDIKLSVAMIKQERLKNDINGDSRGGLDVTYGGEDDKIKLSVAVPRKEKFKNRKSGHGRRMKTGNHKGKLMAKENILKQEEVALLNALTDDIIK